MLRKKTVPTALHGVDTLVILTEYPWGQRDYERFGVPVFLANGLSTEVWDLTSLARSDMAACPSSLPARRIASLAELRRALSSLPAGRVLLLSFIAASVQTWPILRTLSRTRLPYLVIKSAFMSSIPPQLTNLWRRIVSLRPQPILDHLFSLFNPRLLGIAPPRFAFVAGGSQARKLAAHYGPDTEILCAHTLDYDIYLQCRDLPRNGTGSTAVFLDGYLPYHPDCQRLGVAPYVTAEQYYPLLNRFFEALERRSGLRVVIAAHPRSHYEEHEECFPGREIVKGRTAELVRDAGLVMLHASTAVNFAVLFNKPMLFLTSDALAPTPWGRYTQSVAAELDQTPLNMDAPLPDVLPSLDMHAIRPAYARYRDRYVKTKGTADKPSWQFLVDHLRSGGTAP
ncbi:hypothetical protein [Solidesulfovibrio sp.]|uniref:hypothetical protein n=1 Tax=Solidesulfovibrio sp. TaxID=2910990 RepID=UPI002B21271B|nr:hypothetical protein [Solidesulfovibrio sp.]MEA5088413.1 hypothetical protein [Solidesulfovibrio sp.]